MLFNSITFVIFFLIVLVIHRLLKKLHHQKIFLLTVSYLFYSAWNPPFVLLLWLSTLVDWYAAKKIEVHHEKKYLFLSLFTNLGLLCTFKYGNFLLENFQYVLSSFNINFTFATPSIILPVGISFYTFQTLSYTLDVYRGKMKRSQSFIDFALFVTFFPQLVAGPIVRAKEFLPQCERPLKAELHQLGWGLFLVTLGLFQKVVLADTFLADSADRVFGWSGPVHMLDSWIGLFAFSGQIFFDFSGYSTCAIGAALCLGFHLPDNFRFPYAAHSPSDFWRRWHISLSTWLRDYLYIPLGGNRHGIQRTLINLSITMFLGGLWHGASWTFVWWGVLHGIYLVVEHGLKELFPNRQGYPFLNQLITLFFICLAWVFFRAKTLASAKLIFLTLFGLLPGTMVLTTLQLLKVTGVIFSLFGFHWYLKDKSFEDYIHNISLPKTSLLWSFMVFAIIITQGGGNAFIYFQF